MRALRGLSVIDALAILSLPFTPARFEQINAQSRSLEQLTI